MTPPDGSRPHARAFQGLLVVACGLAAWRLARMLSLAHYGIDFTDEGYYLVWIRQPFSYPYSVTQFGFVYHPLDVWLGGDVPRLRQANILLTVVLAWVLTIAFFRAVLDGRAGPATWRSPPVLALAAAMATTFPNLLGQWLPTPSYNSLALQALLVVGTGLLLLERGNSAAGILGWLLLSVGGWLAFMAKPSTAAAVGVVVVVYLLVARVFRPVMCALALALALLLLALSALAIDGSIVQFVQRLRGGLEMIRAIGVEQPWRQLLRVDALRMGLGEVCVAVLTGLLLTPAALASVESGARSFRRLGWLCLAVLTLALLAIAAAEAGLGPLASTGLGRWRGLAVLALPCAALAAAVSLQRRRWIGAWDRKILAVGLCFTVLPHALAFGTGNNYWHTASVAGLFWVLAGLAVWLAAVPRPVSWQALVPFAVAMQLLGLLAVQAAVGQPYRQPYGLTHQARDIAVSDRGSRLALTAVYADYVGGLRRIAAQAGWQPGTPLIDLTGHAPGPLYSLGADAIGQPWLLGGYPGSDGFARKALALVPCESMARAWILIEPAGPRPLSAARVLASAGLHPERDYRPAGSLTTPPGYGGYAQGSEQSLLVPVGDPALRLAACHHARERTP